MLLWQRIAWHKRYTFLSKLFLFSALIHSSLLFAIFFLYRGENSTQHINLDRHDITVMFLPFQKTVERAPVVARSEVQGQAGFRVVKTLSKNKNESSKGPKKNGPVSLGSASKTSFVADVKKANKKQVKSKKQIKSVKKEEKIIAQKIIEEIKPEQSSLVDSVENNGEDILYAGRHDLDALELRQIIRDEIEHVWHPPVGLTTASCKVRVLVDWQGQAEEIVFEESSKVLAFDTSVRHALLTMKFPKSSYGKELILPFH